MTYQIFNQPAKAASITAVILLISTIIMSTNTFAVEGLTTQTETKTTSAFCTNINKETGAISEKMTNLSSKLAQAWADQDLQVNSKLNKVNSEAVATREKVDASLKSNFTKLETKAKTDDEKQAVQTYENAVKEAVAARRLAYDAARQTFHDAVKEQVVARRNQVLDQLDTFKSSVNTAMNAVKTACSSGEGKAIDRTAYQTNLKEAHTKFQNKRTEDDSIKNSIKQLAEIRTAAFKTANQAFRSSLEAAKNTLQQSFNNDSSI